MQPLLLNSLNTIQKCIAFFSPTPLMGVGKNTRGSLVIVERVWNPLCTNFSFPQAVGEDTISTCCAYVQGQILLLRVAFIRRRFWDCVWRGIVCPFRPF